MLPPPFEVRRPADGAPHKLDVAARGYAPLSRSVTLDRDHTESVALVRAGGGGTYVPVGKPGAKPGATAGPDDVDLNKEPRGNRTTRPIDDQDPYK